jgi:hypothetical protein
MAMIVSRDIMDRKYMCYLSGLNEYQYQTKDANLPSKISARAEESLTTTNAVGACNLEHFSRSMVCVE